MAPVLSRFLSASLASTPSSRTVLARLPRGTPTLGDSFCWAGTATVSLTPQQARLLTPCLCTQLTSYRHFGRGKAPPQFAHRQTRSGTFLLLPSSIILLLFFQGFIDWTYLKEEFGINVPILGPYLTDEKGELRLKPVPRAKEKKLPDSAFSELHDRRHEVHEFLREEAEKRYDEQAELVKREMRPDEEKNLEFLQMLQQSANVKSVKAKEAAGMARVEELETTDEEGEMALTPTEKKAGVGFRSRKIMEYENRIRQYSTPDKIFRYFATYKVSDEKGHLEVMMTPEDFLRSITPGMKQPEHLGLDQFTTVNVDYVERLAVGVEESSIFYQLGAGGLISFSDYIFLLTVLSTSRRHFEIAFKMFDLNGDGNVDAKEFEVVTNLMKSQSSMGARHRDHGNTGSTFKGINSGLINFFFGEAKEGILTVDKFLEFQRRLQNEILALEFRRKLPENATDRDHITEKDFAELLIAYAGFPSKKRAKMLKRVRREFHGEDSALKGVSLSDYLHFYQVLYSINDIDTALTFYHIAGAPIERETMKHVAKTVAGVDLSDHLINVVFVLFDENGDGKLSNKEFVSVMKQRAMRGLEKPKDTGIGKIFSAVTKCAGDTRPTILGGLRKTE